MADTGSSLRDAVPSTHLGMGFATGVLVAFWVYGVAFPFGTLDAPGAIVLGTVGGAGLCTVAVLKAWKFEETAKDRLLALLATAFGVCVGACITWGAIVLVFITAIGFVRRRSARRPTSR